MDDKRTPMEAEVQELPEQPCGCPEDYYGTAVRPKPSRSYVGLWICLGLAVIAICTISVVTAVKHVRLENGKDGWRFALQNQEETEASTNPVRNLELPGSEQAAAPHENGSDDLRLPVASGGGELLSPTEIYESVSSAVVCVELSGYYGSESYTGVVISSDGFILSATDGLSGAASISVSFPDGAVRSAKRIGEDSLSGVCLLKVEAEKLPCVRFSSNAEPRIGQSVYCIGNPYGSQFPNVFSEGMLSASRSVEVNGRSFRLMQTNALPGGTEYGCPLLDERGLVLGITTPIGMRLVSGTDPCFAVSAEDLVGIVTGFEQAASENTVWLGFEVADIPEQYREFFRFPGSVWIDSVSAGSASDGILYQYDIITAVDGVEISGTDDFERVLAAHSAGDRVLLTIYRNGRFSYYLLPIVTR